jgi:isoleucyl-tRNA synthetase
MKDYKDTLNLPQTKFPMKASLSQKEPQVLKFWENERIYEKIIEKNQGKENFILHDGPPYANGHLHLGHALNKILKDIIVKYKAMKGFYAPYVPGWDCHGLPIEHEVDKKLGSKKYTISPEDKRQQCRDYATRFVDIQREEFKRLGVFGDWGTPYLTMSRQYEAAIAREFVKFLTSGAVYKGKKPVHWCPACVTALAEAEVEYFEKSSPSVYVAFQLESDIKSILPELFGKNVFLVIWTTTPWTLPANLAIALHPDVMYAAVDEGERGVFVVAEDLLGTLREKFSFKGHVVERFSGKALEGHKAEHPFIERESLIVTGEFVSVTDGTGAVHIAPGHGEEDYEVGLRYGLDIYAPVDKLGRFTDNVEGLSGEPVYQANPKIVDILAQKNMLLSHTIITHSYPHCWRCKRPVIFRATEQWFISMEHGELRKKACSEIERVQWIPAWGKDRLYGMVSNRPDWCISRQRVWGSPVTIIECKKCGEIIRDKAVMDLIIDKIEHWGSDVWLIEDIESFVPSGFRCPVCEGDEFVKEMDILDVWFDSGVSHAAVLEPDERLSWPAHLYLEGSDQHRGWFQSSLLTCTGTRSRAPYEAVLTHGFVVDGQGKKMSKSIGNVITPEQVIKKQGAEILRLWVSAADYRDDMRISEEIINRLVEAYRKIRNTSRFLLGNTADFTPDIPVAHEDLLEIDRLALSKLQSLIKKVNRAYETYDFHEVFHRIYNFCISDMSAFYLDILKDRLYTFKFDSPQRRASQWVLFHILVSLTKMMAPILSFMAEEIWQFIRGKKEESVFLSDFPSPVEESIDTALENKWSSLIIIRDEVNKALELKRHDRFIGNSLEARVTLYADNKQYNTLLEQKHFLPALFIVSGVQIQKNSTAPDDSYKSTEISGLSIVVQKAAGLKCQRCWNWSSQVGTFEEFPEVCERCYEVLKRST